MSSYSSMNYGSGKSITDNGSQATNSYSNGNIAPSPSPGQPPLGTGVSPLASFSPVPNIMTPPADPGSQAPPMGSSGYPSYAPIGSNIAHNFRSSAGPGLAVNQPNAPVNNTPVNPQPSNVYGASFNSPSGSGGSTGYYGNGIDLGNYSGGKGR